MACLQIYQELLLLATFLWVHSNSEEVSYLSWQNTYPNLKTTCHIKLKFFLGNKLPKNLLLAKYLISVGATLKAKVCFWFCDQLLSIPSSVSDIFFSISNFRKNLEIEFTINLNKYFWIMINSFRVTLLFWLKLWHTVKQI